MKQAYSVTIITNKTLEELDKELSGMAEIVAINPARGGPVVIQWNDYRKADNEDPATEAKRAKERIEKTKKLNALLREEGIVPDIKELMDKYED